MSKPQIVEVSVHFGGEGKIALKDYGKASSGYSANLSQRYSIPEDWTEAQALEFQLSKVAELKAAVEPILQDEWDARWAEKDWR